MIGDPADMLGRLRAVLPARWFPDVAPVLSGLLSGLAQSASATHDLVLYARQQTRIATAMGVWLDRIATDFFGVRVSRGLAEGDSVFRARINRELLRPRATRAALSQALTDLTGSVPWIFEPMRPADTGAWGGAVGYGVAGGWGSLSLPFQSFVVVKRPPGVGIAGLPGWRVGGGYGRNAGAYGNLAMLSGVTDPAILATIAGVMPTDGVAWTRITS